MCVCVCVCDLIAFCQQASKRRFVSTSVSLKSRFVDVSAILCVHFGSFIGVRRGFFSASVIANKDFLGQEMYTPRSEGYNTRFLTGMEGNRCDKRWKLKMVDEKNLKR